jgi:hypothetical protein
MFPAKNGLKQGDALMPLFLNFALVYSIRKVYAQINGLKLNVTHCLCFMMIILIYWRGNVHTVMKNTDAFLRNIKESGLEIHAYKSKYIMKYRDHNAGQNCGIKTDNIFFEILE